MAEPKFEIEIDASGMTVKLQKATTAYRTGARKGVERWVIFVRGQVKAGLGQPGRPKSREGILSRSIVSDTKEDANSITGRVGSTLPFKRGYAAILELGGPIPEIRPKKGKFLRFPRATGLPGLAFQGTLSGGGTYKQAKAAAVKVHRRLSGLRGKALDRQAFVYVKKVPARYQRAMPYIRPEWDAAKPQAPILVRGEIKKALGIKEISGGLGEG